ncbi:3'-5' RNA helicase YTHDC2-like [Drosophila simulans]|uniref:3'-5' RNA helicase YTHDC2-like n=1 Tax=Drosophila simulans TaxID=7240 RepID=UPI00192CF21E|nr:3'-5' RNA helicase YTHDC2 [Drosophila simulans]XP_039153875.1 3'-5' RNA helicase YTHDC2 [Drosophila simulans]XP_044779704.1 3'-5' RNA helicase YTHDC2-like [Drosophila simulans]
MADSEKVVKRGRRQGRKKAPPDPGQAALLVVDGRVTGGKKGTGKQKTRPGNAKADGGDKLNSEDEKMLRQLVNDFLQSCEPMKQLPGLTKAQRSHVHRLAQNRGLKTVSKGSEEDRVLFISRPQSEDQQQYLLCNTKLHICPPLLDVLGQMAGNVERRLINSVEGFKRKKEQYQDKRRPSNFGLVGQRLIPPPQSNRNRNIQHERRSLPIYKQRESILNVLQRDQVLIIKGATGSGKSTQLPQYILEWAAEHRSPVRIVVSQPRRLAAISVSERISKERGEAPGTTVGYQIRMNRQCSSNTVLMLTTSGCLLRALAMDKESFFKNTTHLIIDEAHERDLDTDFLLLATKLELQKNPHLRVVLMSATMDLEALSNYFGGGTVMDVEGRNFGVAIYHLEDILSNTGYMHPRMEQFLGKPTGEETPSELLAAYYGGRTIIDPDIDNDLIVSLLELLLRQGDAGAVIVYLPGYSDMTSLLARLESSLPQDQITIILLHSQVDNNEHRKVFRVYPGVRLKIILSTNIGQTSITIPDLLYVIDTGRAKMKTYDMTIDASQLTITWISQADAKQRAGRAGRVCHGNCYRLYDNDRLAKMDLYTVPEIVRRTLDEICLLTKLAAPDKKIENFLDLALDTPPKDAVIQSCSRLKLLGVLDERDEVTQLGHIIAELPLGVQIGKCLVYSIYLRCLDSMTIIAAYHSVRDPFVLNIERGKKSGQQNRRILFAGDGMSDSLAAIKLYEEFTNLKRMDIGDFCEHNFVCRNAMEMFVSAVSTLRYTVYRIFRFSEASARLASSFNDDTNMIRLALTAGLYPKLAYMDREKKNQLVAEGDPFVQVSRSSCLLGKKKQKNLASEWILFLEKTRTADQTSSLEYTTLVSGLMVALAGGKQFVTEAHGFEVLLCLDSWIRLKCPAEFGLQLHKVRMLMEREFAELVATRKVSLVSDFIGPETVRRLLKADMPSTSLAEGKSLLD